MFVSKLMLVREDAEYEFDPVVDDLPHEAEVAAVEKD